MTTNKIKPWTQLLTFAHIVQSFKQKSDVDGGGMRLETDEFVQYWLILQIDSAAGARGCQR